MSTTTDGSPKGDSSSHRPQMPFVFCKLSPAKPTCVYDTYWRFAAERQAIFHRRFRGDEPPWTEDAVMRTYKFTNAYRASDRVSQFLIKHVIYEGDQSAREVVFRILLFKIFNRIDTWRLFERKFGTVTLADYSIRHYDAVLNRELEAGGRIYSAAYIMPTGKCGLHSSNRKHRMHLELLGTMMREHLAEQLANAASMATGFELLKAYPTIGDFLGYQFITDVNYSSVTGFSEMEFTIPGPGARDGIRKCFSDLGGLNEAEIIRLVADRQEQEFERLGLQFESLWGRRLQLIDCQNLFCEVDKYSRAVHPDISGISGRGRIKQKYHRNMNIIPYWYPPKWQLNDRIDRKVTNV